ncbi:hypothetical protein IP98_00405 [Flavobacterium cauense R2A-7]|uniref:DUF5723 domain-containing protein n=1 Tax=Flavobacterium cauense R2A-7 TaxID=1341154 RepID=A0A562M6G5_9FLAO|nr:DUF5723 family protein [Flavobacterium cauense]KGO82435.1 hypothetical protein Q762_07135 [Flavobacterium cauense R2A-7]TWI15412.1 hypothetical protein IP98_00405 [Flavobacterium cauense R2A-7]
MKKQLLLCCSLLSLTAFSQEHFSGINISKRSGLLNATVNPAELVNMSRKFDVAVFNTSVNVSNNKIKFNDIMKGENLEDKIFTGSDPTSIRLDVLIQGPSVAMKYKKWAFALASAGNIKANATDVDVNFGNAVTNSFLGTAQINSQYNQRLNAASWGEINLSAARNIFENDDHKFSGGVTLKLLFPGSYMNMGVDKLQGQVTNDITTGDVYLYNATANVNFSYSGSLANSYNDNSNYTNLFAGGLNGVGADFGFNYQWKEKVQVATDGGDKTVDEYKLNAGLSFRNMGSMTFKDDNNESANYQLTIPTTNPLNLADFENSESVRDIEQILMDRGYLTKQSSNGDFRVKLPAVLNAYIDYKIHNKWYVSAYTQQKLSDDSQNDFTTIQNIITLTPRFAGKNYELYLPLSSNEVSGFTTGFGFRLGGFFLGSGSIVTAALNNSKQADIYMGFRFGI